MGNIRADLTVADIQRAKQLLEDRVRAEVTDALRECEARIGFTPSAIDVRLARIERVGEARPDYAVDVVTAEIRIS